MYTIHNLNRELKKIGLKLRKDTTGYFYYVGLTESAAMAVSNCDESTSIYVDKFNHLTQRQWKEEVEIIIKKLGI